MTFNNLLLKKLFLFDIDGTIAIDSDLIPGTRELLSYIDRIGGKAVYITNNSTKSNEDYILKFKKWDIATDASNFVTSAYATCLHLKKQYENDKIFVVGTKSFVRELKDFGLNIMEKPEKNVKCIVVGFDNELNYDKIADVCKLLETTDADYYATNPDLACPTSFGFVPDCGAICKMIEYATGKKPVYIGKPNPAIVDMCIENTGYCREQTIVIGDRLYTDIACGIQAGVDTAVVFTGEAKERDLTDTPYQPTWHFKDIRELYRAVTGQ